MSLTSQSASSRRWLVFVVTYMVMILNVGFFYSVGVLFNDIMDAFGSNRAETAVIQSTGIAVGLGSGFLHGIIINKFGLVKAGVFGTSTAFLGVFISFFAASIPFLIISLGIIMPLGFSCSFITSAIAIGHHFSGKQRLLMLSIQSSGAGVGGMMYPYFLRYLSDLYGFRGALLIVSGVVMNLIPACVLFRKPATSHKQDHHVSQKFKHFQSMFGTRVVDGGERIKIERNTLHKDKDMHIISHFPVLPGSFSTKTIVVQMGDQQQSKTNNGHKDKESVWENIKAIVQNRTYVLFTLGLVLSNPSVGLIIIFIVDIFLDKGFTREDASLGLTLINVLILVGRLMPGLLMQSRYVSTLTIPIFASALAAVAMFTLPLVESQWLTVTLCALVGMPMGIFLTIFSIGCIKIVGQEKLPIAMGLAFTSCSVVNAVAGPVSGFARDQTGSYNIPFIVGSASNFIAVVLFFVAMITQRRRKRQTRRRSSVFYLTSL